MENQNLTNRNNSNLTLSVIRGSYRLHAITKGFIDRLFLPGFAFKYRENSVFSEKLLLGKTAHIITTLDQPGWYYWLVYGRPSVNQLRKSTLQFCGINPVKVNYFGPIRNSKEGYRKKAFYKDEKIGSSFH
jgi:NAD(P)H dehydrogenase (quinone)